MAYKNWNSLKESATTIQYKNSFSNSEKNGDLRARIYKLGMSSLKIGMIFVGYVINANQNGCFIKIGEDCIARANLSELSDLKLNEDISKEFFINRIVIGLFIYLITKIIYINS